MTRSSQTILDARRAEGIIRALRKQESTGCADCQHDVDLAGATTTEEVVARLVSHREEYHD